MNKTLYYIALAAAFWLLLFSLFFVAFPQTLVWFEGDSLFIYSKEVIKQIFSKAPGATNVVTQFSLQFFQSPLVGALIYSGVLTLSSLPAFFIAKRLNTKWIGLCFLPAALFAFIFPLHLSAALSNLFFLTVLAIFFHIKNKIVRGSFVLLACASGYFFIPFFAQIILCTIFAFMECYFFKMKSNLVFPLVSFLIIGFTPSIVSNNFFFIPFDQRYSLTVDDVSAVLIFLAYVPTVVLLLLSVKIPVKHRLFYSPLLMLTFLAVPSYSLVTDEKLEAVEESYLLAQMAEEGQWNDLLSRIDYQDYGNSIKLSYALLSESALGTLPERLFSYPVASEKIFNYPHQTDPYLCNFNRLYYKNIGVDDEAFHQAFEYGTIVSSSGLCFKSLRNMTDGALAVGDTSVAEKYLYLLSLSACHDSWVANRTEQLYDVKKKKNDSLPLRSNSFIGLFNFNSEMVRLLQEDTTNIRKLDYLLCGLLLRKKVDQFEVVIKSFPLYKGKKLPRAYAEAAAMLKALGRNLDPQFQYPEQFDNDFADFYNLHQRGDMLAKTKYQGSYWNYYMYATIDEE